MSPVEKAQANIHVALREVEHALANPRHLPEGITEIQLRKCEKQLRSMLNDLETNTYTRKEYRETGMGRMIIDSWPLSSSIGEAILGAEMAYLAIP